MTEPLGSTRRSLHGVVEGILAGHSYRTLGTIRLIVDGAGIRTRDLPGTPALLAVTRAGLVVTGPDGRTTALPLAGTFGALAAAAGVVFEPPAGSYPPAAGVRSQDEVHADPEGLSRILDWFGTGRQALVAFATTAVPAAGSGAEPVLWPEHLDLGLALDEVNYGVSAGDHDVPEPYAYVGPWTPREGTFWNAPFGAARPAAELATVQDVAAFFAAGRTAAAAG